MSTKQGHERVSAGKGTDQSLHHASTSVNDRYTRQHLKPIAKSVY